MPTVSIITACYKAEKYLERTIASVRAQTFADWEHILVDDGSPDNFVARVAPLLAEEPRLRLIQQPNGGVCRARNHGARAASLDSRFLLFLDQDDCLERGMLSSMCDYLEARPEVGMAFCKYVGVGEDDLPVAEPDLFARFRFVPDGRGGVRTLPHDEPPTSFVSLFAFPDGGVYLPATSLLRRCIFEQTPGWDETFGQHAEDVDLFLHIALRSSIHFVPRSLVRYRRHAAQVSGDADNARRQRDKLYAKWRAGDGLTAQQQDEVVRAWEFRQKTLLPYLWRTWGGEHLRAGRWSEGVKSYLRGWRQVYAGKA